jgi:hypothetical protein
MPPVGAPEPAEAADEETLVDVVPEAARVKAPVRRRPAVRKPEKNGE